MISILKTQVGQHPACTVSGMLTDNLCVLVLTYAFSFCDLRGKRQANIISFLYHIMVTWDYFGDSTLWPKYNTSYTH